MILWQAVCPRRHQRPPHIDQKHLGLRRLPAQPVPERPPGQADQPFHADVPQDVPALLELPLLGPGPVGALHLGVGHVREAGLAELVAHAADAEEVGPERGEPSAEELEKVAPRVDAVAGGVVAGGNVFEFLHLDVAAGFQMSTVISNRLGSFIFL